MASLTLLEPPTTLDPSHAQAIVREAPRFLKAQKGALQLPYPASLLLSNESQEKWVSYENILISSLQTGDYALAKECVEALTARFGKLNERVIIFQGMYDEAMASSENELKAILKRYDDVITESPTMFSVRKRRIALLKSMGKTSEAVTSLVELLDASPTDAEAWIELADLYQSQGAVEQTIFSLEEALLVVPNAWNIQAKLGEVLYLSAGRADGLEKAKLLSESIRRFCRSVELSSQYIRAYYGLKQATTTLLALTESLNEPALPSKQTVQKLNELAIAKLAELLRLSKTNEKGWNGYEEAELNAVQDLLSREQNKVTR